MTQTLNASDLLASIRQIDILEPMFLQELENTPEYASDDASGVVRVAVERGWVTPFQAARLVDGQTASLHIGGYILQDVLGESPMGTWYKATFGRTPPEVQLLRVSSEWLGNRDSTPTFLARLLACVPIRNRFIVPVLDAGANGVEPFLVNEILEGADLATFVRDMGPMPYSLACEYVRQAALGLQALHAAGITHGNINPNTLILSPVKRTNTPNGVKVRLVPGATVRLTEVGLTPNRSPASELVGTTLLTHPAFLPPERITQGGLNPASDIYQLGATLSYLVTGQLPATGDTDSDILATIIQSEPLPVANIPAEINTLIQLMMSREIGFRPPAEVVASRLYPHCEKSAMPGAIPTSQNDLPMVETLPEDHFLSEAEPDDSVIPNRDPRSGVNMFSEDHEEDSSTPRQAPTPRARKISRKTMLLLLFFGLFLNAVAIGGWILYTQFQSDDTEEQKKDDEPKNNPNPVPKKDKGKGKKNIA